MAIQSRNELNAKRRGLAVNGEPSPVAWRPAQGGVNSSATLHLVLVSSTSALTIVVISISIEE